MKRTALITGATAGIGEETARLLSKNDFNLILTGRRKEKLKKLADEITRNSECKVHILVFDIRNREKTTDAFKSLPKEWMNIDVLINNAGLAAGLSTVQEGLVDDWEQMIDTNIKGLLYITRLIAPKMTERNSGHIVNISSIAGKETYPMGNVYCATKHAVQSLTQGMRLDMLKHGIKVSSVSPGAVETEFSLVRFKGDKEKADKVYEGFTPLFAKDIAETILFILTRPAHVNIDDILVMPTAQAFSREFYRK
ncbi:SDR family oxidoreductase [Maribellus maritimus]|uniref:SDR family oxidoreductase n=1 Tax=Maribellus maritimus TaxID=2870838 RepID=UPI001EEBA9F6|nr:SDR family oxidoreductase [Maribellus maritimus]MCG6185839.1 SDR family oxidoreductase [Maribellus maritimus]